VRPYDHFSDPSSPCYEKLFTFAIEEGVPFEEDDDGDLLEQILLAAAYE